MDGFCGLASSGERIAAFLCGSNATGQLSVDTSIQKMLGWTGFYNRHVEGLWCPLITEKK